MFKNKTKRETQKMVKQFLRELRKPFFSRLLKKLNKLLTYSEHKLKEMNDEKNRF